MAVASRSALLISICVHSPFRRYHSHASSLPDYGAPDGSMGKGLLKNLNATPIARLNTLDRPVAQASQRSTDRPPAKRQRRESLRVPNSRHFSTSQQGWEEGANQDGSLDDPYDIRSQSSAGHGSQVSSTAPRKRPRRKPKLGGLLVAQEMQSRASSGSPDVFAVDELDEPLPVNVSSDIPSASVDGMRGRRMSHIELPFKRQGRASATVEKIQDSEDELAQTEVATVGNLKKRRLTNFDSLQTRETKRRSITKGDITPTDFRSSKRSDNRRKANSACNLKGVITGAEIWESSPSETAALVLDDANIFRFSRNGKPDEGSAFEIKMDTIQNFSHDINQSCFVSLRRRQSFGARSQIWLQFSSLPDVVNFVQSIPFAQARGQQSNAEKLEQTFQHKRKVARDYQAKPAPSGSLIQASTTSSAQQSSPNAVSGGGGGNRGLAQEDWRTDGSERPRREKLVNKMASSLADSSTNCQDLTKAPNKLQFPEKSLRSGIATYRTRRSSPKIDVSEEVKLNQWTHKNPNWQSQWHKSLVYPATGKNRTTVDAVDILRLDEGEFLNDNLINFYLRYLQVQLEREQPELLKKMHIFSSFFYEKLKSATKYEGVKSWTAKIDLFSYDYIIVPVNEHAHWYLAIICNVGQTLPEPEPEADSQDDEKSQIREVANLSSPRSLGPSTPTQAIPIEDEHSSPRTVRVQDEPAPSLSVLSPELFRPEPAVAGISSKVDAKTPKIITLDSLDGSHSATCRTLKTYLESEAQDKKGVQLPFLPGGMKGKDIPHQDNFCDCGVFVLGYMEEFLKNPDEAARRLLQKEKLDWSINPQDLRNKIRGLLFDLQEEQQGRLEQELAKKKALRLQKKATALSLSGPSIGNSMSQSRDPSTGSSTSKPPTPRSASAPSPKLDSHKEYLILEKEPPMPPADTDMVSIMSLPQTLEGAAQHSPLGLHSLPKNKSPTNDSECPKSLPGSSPSDASLQAFYSAPSSPSDTARLRSEFASSVMDGADDRPPVKLLPSSDSENAEVMLSKKNKKNKKKKRKPGKEDLAEDDVQPSVEMDEDEAVARARLQSPEPVTWGSEQAAQATTSSYFTVAPDVHERAPQPQSPQDGGIQQSIE